MTASTGFEQAEHEQAEPGQGGGVLGQPACVQTRGEQSDVPEGALSVLRRGLRRSPDMRRGLAVSALLGLSVALMRLVSPVLIQRAIDLGILHETGVNTSVVRTNAVLALIVMGTGASVLWVTQRRLVTRAEAAIAKLRTDAFDHVHRLAIADHNEMQRGVLVARVTSDAEALAKFAQWGLWSWTINPALIVGIMALLTWYSPVLAGVVLVAYLPVIPALRWLQRRQLIAYDAFRAAVGAMFATFSEAVTGAAVVRAYGAEDRTRDRLRTAIDTRYRARLRASRFMAGVFVVGDFFGALAFSGVLIVGVTQRDALGLNAGELVACLFLTTLLNEPIAEIGETLDHTQTAVAGWRKILDLLDRPIDIVEVVDGQSLPEGPLAVDVVNVGFSYRTGEPVLHDVSFSIAAGSNVAIVGATGSGKSTMARLLCRLADPTSGQVMIGNVTLTNVSAPSRLAGVRMVPQDGFLFDTTVAENISFGRAGSSTADILAAFDRLSLRSWLDELPDGLETRVGERGGRLSVGERQLVALVRAALADPGLLILDEATSAIDPRTDAALTNAIRRLAVDRTVVSIAHRLATAEQADLILVFDEGRIVEAGPHNELVQAGGVYQALHRAWVGNTRRPTEPE